MKYDFFALMDEPFLTNNASASSNLPGTIFEKRILSEQDTKHEVLSANNTKRAKLENLGKSFMKIKKLVVQNIF